ncbi:MAG: hypothetical protein KatS3mg105_5113 [Gemmatales bacterium]|nr:MAG: hypothetical protein KatS3mg105_5113 [Gemmatales bacterium]
MGLDRRQSTPGFKRQVVVTCAEARSFKRASLWMERAIGMKVSPNTIERISEEVGKDGLREAAEQDWNGVLDGEPIVPRVAIVSVDGGRIRTRVDDGRPGVRKAGTGWNETKNAIFVSAESQTSTDDPQPDPPKCFLDRNHVAKLTETAKSKENTPCDAPLPAAPRPTGSRKKKRRRAPHKPRRIHRTVIASMSSAAEFGRQMKREATRRKFDQAPRRAFIADGLACNWKIHEEHFRDYVAILDFVHAVSYLFAASMVCFGRSDEAWEHYRRWMTLTWRGQVDQVIEELAEQQKRLGEPTGDGEEDDPREQLRKIVNYLRNNRERMRYDEYRRAGLPVTSAWMESAVKEINYRTKGSDMFWNNPRGAEAILHLRAASLCDDDRLIRFLLRRPGSPTLRREKFQPATAA